MSNVKTVKPPVIRPGQRKPYIKGTRSQIDERRGFVARMMYNGATKTEIHQAVRERFHVEWRQTDRYLSWLVHGRERTVRAILPSPPEPAQVPLPPEVLYWLRPH